MAIVRTKTGFYTKHYYAGDQRIASKLGTGGSLDGFDLCAALGSRYNVVLSELDELRYQAEDKIQQDFATIVTNTWVDMDYMGYNTCELQGDWSYEYDLFFYHGNHLSSTQMITDRNGDVVQQVHYAPFGEIISEYNAYWHQDKIPNYTFNAKELDEETGMYYFEARYLKPPSFISRDPLFEKYFWMSPYAYCMNNPLRYIDPTGMKVDPAGEEEAAAYKEYRDLVFSSDDYKDVQVELTRLENAEEVFKIRMGSNISSNSGDGNFTYNKETGEFDINISNEGKFNPMEKLSHELKHADQYMDKKIGFDLRGGGKFGKSIAYDRIDEIEAFTRQGRFGNTRSSDEIHFTSPYKNLNYTNENISNIGKPYTFEGIKNLNSQSYGKYRKPLIMYHGWKKDIN